MYAAQLQRSVFEPLGERLVAECPTAEGGHLCVVRGAAGETLLVALQPPEPESGEWRRRAWPALSARLKAADAHSVTVECSEEEPMRWWCEEGARRRSWARALEGGEVGEGPGEGGEGGADLEERELAALLEQAARPGDAELWARRLAERLGALDAANVQGVLAAEVGSAALLARLAGAGTLATALADRLRRLDRGARAADPRARPAAELADRGARLLLAHLRDLLQWLDAPALRDVDALPEVSLAGAEGRARVLAGAEALRTALAAGEAAGPGALRLEAVRARLRALTRAKERLAAALARHLNNTLIYLANEAAAAPLPAPPATHHADLAPYAPFMAWMRACDHATYTALVKVYTGGWARVYEREVRAQCEAARVAAAADDDSVDAALHRVITYVETTCDAEQEFCTQFFNLDTDSKSGGGPIAGGGLVAGNGPGVGSGPSTGSGAGSESRRIMAELFPTLEGELLALLAHVDRQDPYGAVRVVSCVGARATEGEGAGRWARGALAALAVAAKRQADAALRERLAALPDAVRVAARRQKCGLLPFLAEFEEFCSTCERITAGGRRGDAARWCAALCAGVVREVHRAEHPRTPPAAVRMENYHRLHAVLSALRLPALETERREARRLYAEAQRAYVTRLLGRPLDGLTQFFEGAAEAVARGVREDELRYQPAYSKHALRRLLALYPRAEVARSLRRLYRAADKHLSEEGGLLQVVWRAMQEEFMAQYKVLESRLQAYYPGAGLALPFSAQDILDVFSDIAQDH